MNSVIRKGKSKKFEPVNISWHGIILSIQHFRTHVTVKFFIKNQKVNSNGTEFNDFLSKKKRIKVYTGVPILFVCFASTSSINCLLVPKSLILFLI